MKKLQILAAALLAVSLVPVPAAAHEEGPDTRNAIRLDPASRAMVLVEMRQFLGGVQQITEALSRDDLKTVAQAARAVGMHAAHEVPDSVKAKLPMEFKQLGFSVHKGFDQLALDAESLGDARQAMKQLSGILQKCVSCHATYQLVPATAP